MPLNPRDRSKSNEPIHFYTNTGVQWGHGTRCLAESFHESSYPGSNACVHRKYSYGSGAYFTSDAKTVNGGSQINSRSGTGYAHLHPGAIDSLIQGVVPNITLNWGKLLSSSKFNILVALLEFKETILLFGVKFWAGLAANRAGRYGAVTWAIKPLINDLVNLWETGRNLHRRLTQGLPPYEDEFNIDFEGPFVLSNDTSSLPSGKFSVKGKARLTGTYTYPGASILEVFDTVGFHPDIATLWDAIPLSFAVNYLFPLGDVFDYFSGGGWVNAVNFTGWQTVKLSARFDGKRFDGPVSTGTWHESVGHSYFRRDRLSAHALIDPQYEGDLFDPSDFKISRPSFQEMFNMAYLLLARRAGL